MAMLHAWWQLYQTRSAFVFGVYTVRQIDVLLHWSMPGLMCHLPSSRVNNIFRRVWLISIKARAVGDQLVNGERVPLRGYF